MDVDSASLMDAAATVSQSGTWGTWAFLPVTDGKFIQERPSKQLGEGRVNGLNHLAGHNALEGAAWVPPGSISTVDDLVAYLRVIFPNFSNNDIAKVLYYYPSSNATVDPNAALWATEGSYGPTTVNQSTAATGQQQRAIAIYGETTLICPSYWLAEAFSDNGYGGKAYKYQFSIPNAYHGADGALYFSWPGTGSYYNGNAVCLYTFPTEIFLEPPANFLRPQVYAFMSILGNFIVNDDPSISSVVANGVTSGNASYNPIEDWPPYSIYNPAMLDFNSTCPETETIAGLHYCDGPDLTLQLRFADAYNWEGGRGVRCDFWKSLGEKVPE